MSKFTATEVPLITQDHHQELAERYEIRNDLSFSKCSYNSKINRSSKIWNGKHEEWQSRIRGCAASCVSDDTKVISAACAEEPYVISVTKVVHCDLAMVEIDLEHVDRNVLGGVIKTFIFVHEKAADEEDDEDTIMSSLDKTIKVVMIDSQSNILQIELDYVSLSPISIAHTPTNFILSQQHIYPLNRQNLSAAQVVAVDENRIVFALSPFILCLNVKSQKVAVWTKESCLHNRRKSLGGVLKSAKDILVGKPYYDIEEMVDQVSSNFASVAALCVFDEINNQGKGQIEGKIVCSLHSDGTLRLWTLPSTNQTFPYPKQTYVLHDLDDVINKRFITPPQLWKSYDDSLLMSGCTFIESKGQDVKFVIAVGIHTTENFADSKVNLTTLVGRIGSKVDLMEYVKMKVPDQIDSLKLMVFSKLAYGWEMHALFNSLSNPLFDEGKSLYHSFSHAPVLKPTVAIYKSVSLSSVFYSNCFFDDYLANERWKLEYECEELSSDEDFLEENDIQVALKNIDQWYLQKIFRSDSFQTIGLYNATDGAIIRALCSVVPPFCLNEDTITDVHKKGIEFLTVFVMNKWSKYEGDRLKKNGTSSASRILSNKTSASLHPETLSSIYREFYRKEQDTPDITEDSDNSVDGLDIERNRYSIKLHHQRWKKLLLAINNEEMKLLSPLALISIPEALDEKTNFVIRPGVTTAILLREQSTSETPSDKLDSIAMSLLDKLENTSSKNRHLLTKLQMKTWQIISKAKLLKNDSSRSFIEFVRSTISDIDWNDWDKIFTEVSCIMETMAEEQIVTWLKLPFPSSFFSSGKMPNFPSKSSSAALPSCRRLCRQYIRYCRHLAFAKFICVTNLSVRKMILFTSEQEKFSLITYLNTVGVSWAYAQVCTLNSCINIEKEDPFESAKSKESFTGTNVIKDKRYILDEGLKKLIKPIGLESLPNIAIESSKLFVQLAFQPISDDFSPTLSKLSPDDSEDKRISLRLLSPLIAFSSNTTISYKRCCMAADYLLSEVTYLANNHNIAPGKMTEMEEIASCLLKQNHTLLPDPSSLNIFLKCLNECEENGVSNDRDLSKRHEKDILQLIEDMDTVSSNQPFSSLSSIFNVEKVKSLLLPLVIKAQHARLKPIDFLMDRLRTVCRDPTYVLRHFVSVMAILENCLLRLSVLKKHSCLLNFRTKASFADLLKSAIKDVIEIVEYHSNPTDYDQIIEYPALWSSLFRASIQGNCWDDAFSACFSHPLKDRQMKNFKRLVTAMADAGALGLLVDKVVYGTFESTSPGKEIDLYEVAVDAFADASFQASLKSSAHHNAFSSNADYSCCLYSLHTAYNHWRRSSQTADFYGALTLNKISLLDTCDNDSRSLTKVPHNEKSKIMNALTLASVASAQLLLLVEDVNAQYIVSGEVEDMVDKMKLSRYSYDCKLQKSLQREHESDQRSLKLSCPRRRSQRLNRLYNVNDLLLRAKRMIVLEKLQKDSFCPDNISDILLASDSALVDALSRLGYVEDAIAFSHCKNENKKEVTPHGRDLLLDAMSHIICKCLGQAALPFLGGNFSYEQEMETNPLISRPTLDQIALILGDSRFLCMPKLWHGSLFDKGLMVMELIRCYTESYSRHFLDLSVEVANTMLESGKRAKLPSWLINVIVCPSSSQCYGGLFGRNGNRVALLNLYIKYGLYVEACALVEYVVLQGVQHERDTALSERLPEKGYIEFFPFQTIDLLWNLIQALVDSKCLEPNECSKLLTSRKEMEKALHIYFQYIKLSEDGLASARVLTGV